MVDGKEEANATPSRISLAALCSPSQSPHPSAAGTKANTPEPVNGYKHVTNGTTGAGDEEREDDVEMVDASQETRGSRANPSRKAKTAANQETAEEVLGGEDEEEEEEDEDYGDEDDDDEDDDDDDDDSDSDTGEERSEMVGVEGETEAARAKDAASTEGESKSTEVAHSGQDNLNGKLKEEEDDELAGKREGEGIEGKVTQKKKGVKRRSPSVDPFVPAGPPPRPTVRLKFSLSLNDESGYMTNVPDEIYKTLKEKDADWARWYESTLPQEEEEEEEEEEGVEGSGEGPNLSELGGLAKLLAKYPTEAPSGKKGGKAKISKNSKKKDLDYEIGEYDTRDPFVDDSELNVDEPTYSAKPTADGFFVSEGEVQLQEIEKSKLEAKREDMLANASKRGQIPPGFGQTDKDAGGAGAMFLELGPTASNVAVVNTMLSRHAVLFGLITTEEEEEDRKSALQINTLLNGDKAAGSAEAANRSPGATQATPIDVVDDDDANHPVPFTPIQPVKYAVTRVPKRLEKELVNLRQLAAKESWLKKSKFPPDLRDPLIKASTIAIALNEFNDNFFNWLPQIFPYNRHTLHKYVRRQIYADHVKYMDKLMAMNEAGMKRQIEELYGRLKKEYDDAMAAWLARGSREGTPAEVAEEPEKEGDGEGDEGEENAAPINKNAKPVKRWHWTEPLRETLFTIMTIDNAKTELKTEKNELESVEERLSVINARKVIYKRLIELWPEQGWTTTTALSNQYGLYKRKVEKFAQMLHEGQGKDIQGAVVL